MVIESLELDGFRNYKKKSFEFSGGINIFAGPNGIGKTNLLEAMVVLSLGKSPRANYERELINLDTTYARVSGTYSNGDKLEVILQRQETGNRVKKNYKINGAVKTGAKFVGTSKIVYFSPEDIRLVTGSPSRRRDFLDSLLSQTDSHYYSALLKYGKVLRQRNKLLEQLRGQMLHNVQQVQLEFWNKQLLEAGVYLQDLRKKFFQKAKEVLPETSARIYKGKYRLSLNYVMSEISEEHLDKVSRKEIALGTTAIGPHRDDFSFILENSRKLELKSYGSRGEQRLAVLALKIAELKWLGENPILLLDDIFSELDENYRAALEDIILDQQTILTTADLDLVPDSIKQKAGNCYNFAND